MLKTSLFIAAIAAVLVLPAANAQQPEFHFPKMTPIEAQPQPGAIPLRAGETLPGDEQWDQLETYRIVRNVVSPTLTPFLPDAATATGAAVVVAPGGGFSMLSWDTEGVEVAKWLQAHGVAAFVLKYRVRPTNRDIAVFQQETDKMLQNAHPGPGLKSPEQALEDGKAAMRIVRERAREWNIDPNRVGFLGFSAGAILTLDMGLLQDKAVRPDFIGVIYGPLWAHNPPADAPPLFSAVAIDDPLFSNGKYDLITEWHDRGRPVELHVYEGGSHGFGMRKTGTTSELWIDQFYAFIKDLGFLKKS